MSNLPAITSGQKAYVDTNIFIYYIETDGPAKTRIMEFFTAAKIADTRLVTSEITLAECMLQPARNKNRALIEKYELLLEDDENVELVPLSGAVTKLAALKAGDFGLKLIDSIHLVSAFQSGCDFFLTNDDSFKSSPSLQVIHIAR